MVKRLFLSSLCLFVFLLQACGGDKAQNGSLTIRADLTISNIEIEGVTPNFSPDFLGVYEATVDNSVEEIEVTLGELNEESGVEIVVFRSNASAVELDVQEGSTVTMPLDEGDNVVVVRVQTSDAEQRLDYNFSIRRVSSSADLSFIVFPNLDSVVTSAVEFDNPGSFDSDVTSYELSLPYSRCTIALNARAESKYAQLSLDGEEINNGSTQYLDLPVGESSLEIEVSAENGSATKAYSLSFQREEATAEELEADYRLSDLSIAQGSIGSASRGSGFNCYYREYVARVDNDQSFVSISATPVVDGRAVRVGRQVEVTTQDDSGADVTELVVEEWFDLPSDGSTNLDVEVGDENVFMISLRDDDDGEPLNDYSLTVTRGERNRTIVETGAELQAALQTAQPNDEILIAADQALVADSSASASGKEGSVFYSNASGTEDQSIVLINASNVELSPSSGSEAAVVFELAGDFWEIINLDISGGSTGLLLNNASNNILKNIDVTQSSSVGVQVLNGSNHNAFSDLAISELGGEGLVVGSDAATWTSAPVPGVYEPDNVNNHFGTLSIGPYINDTLLRVEEGAENTVVRSGVFNLLGINTDPDTSVIEVQGNATEISFSEFQHSSSSSPAVIVNVVDTGYEWLSEPWGEGTLFTHNVLDLVAATGIDVLSADSSVANVHVSRNVRTDDADLIYSGASVSQDGPEAYQIQWVDWASVNDEQSDIGDHTYCLERSDITLDLISTSGTFTNAIPGVIAATCEASETEQQWLIENDGEGYFLLKDAAGEFIAAPTYQGVMVSQGADSIALFSNEDFGQSEAAFLRWTFETGERGDSVISNKLSRSHVLVMDVPSSLVYAQSNLVPTAIGTYTPVEDEDAQILYIQTETEDIQSGFTLLPIE